jgi:hypothetical protein
MMFETNEHNEQVDWFAMIFHAFEIESFVEQYSNFVAIDNVEYAPSCVNTLRDISEKKDDKILD